MPEKHFDVFKFEKLLIGFYLLNTKKFDKAIKYSEVW